jgi:CheY-like chemotaxis protein
VESPVDQLVRTSDEASLEKQVDGTARKFRVLYVEDNLANLSLVQRILASRNDIELIPCMQGDLALELARLHKPHLLLLDLHLPDISGEEVLVRLRKTPEVRDIPAIIVSADATLGQTGRLVALGAQGYVTKPLEMRKFLAVVDDALTPVASAA